LNTIPEYLKQLLEQEKWTNEEKEWMQNYLEKADLSELETVAADSFYADLASANGELDRRASSAILDDIHHRIDTSDAPARKIKRVWMLRRIVAAAAIIIILAGAGYLLRQLLTNGANRDLAYNGLPGAGSMRQVVTALRERRTVQMPDGTQVSLEQGSTLDYPERFSGKTREVTLKGEAFFEVTADPNHPFIVHTDLIKTTVLGTSFNVESYPEGKEARVVVVTGKVKVETVGEGKEQQEVVVIPNQRAVYYELPDRLEKQEAAAEALFCQQRRNGRFIYTGVAVAKVVEDMQRFYHTSLELQGNVRNCIFHGHFHTSDDLDKALHLIAIPLNASIRRDSTAGDYIIYGGGCQ
jgi:ferric-dicitrate binding protein FerR (iron transport regulator)